MNILDSASNLCQGPEHLEEKKETNVKFRRLLILDMLDMTTIHSFL